MSRFATLALAVLLAGPAHAQSPAPPAEPPIAPMAPPAAPVAPAAAPVAPAAAPFATERQNLGTTVSGISVYEVDLVAGPAASRRVRGSPDAMVEILARGFAELTAASRRAGLVAVNAPIAVFVEIDDRTFAAELMLPLASALPAPTQGLQPATTPAGRAIRVLHVGSHESLEETYAEIETFIEDKNLDIRELFVERYLSDPATTAPMDLRTEVFVMLR